MPMKKSRAEVEHFHNFLKRAGKKKTYQKDLILETFLNNEGHLSVEDVYAFVKKKDKKVGIVTVFRTLLSLEECGIARRITLGDGLTRFEHRFRHPYHHHIICTECHRAIEFICPELEHIQDEVIRKYHFKPAYNRFQTYGVCRDCQENRPAMDAPKHDTEKIFARDAIKMALDMELRCLEFYTESAQRNTDIQGRQVFERMILEEEKHIEELKAELDRLFKEEKDLDRAPVFLHFDPVELESMIPDLSKYESEGEISLDSKTAIELSSELNRNASEFFKKYANQFTDTMGKRIFMNFADQEENHSSLMKRSIEGRF